MRFSRGLLDTIDMINHHIEYADISWYLPIARNDYTLTCIE